MRRTERSVLQPVGYGQSERRPQVEKSTARWVRGSKRALAETATAGGRRVGWSRSRRSQHARTSTARSRTTRRARRRSRAAVRRRRSAAHLGWRAAAMRGRVSAERRSRHARASRTWASWAKPAEGHGLRRRARRSELRQRLRASARSREVAATNTVAPVPPGQSQTRDSSPTRMPWKVPVTVT
jgi:hypothetical protein